MAKYKAKKLGVTPILYSILMIVMGVLLIVGGSSAAANISQIMVTVIGAILIVFGIYNAVIGFIGLGAVQMVFGILMIAFAWYFVWLAFLFLGVILFAYGIQGLVRKDGWFLTNIIDLVIGVAIILLALGFKFSWAATLVEIIYIVAGVMLVIDGILSLIRR